MREIKKKTNCRLCNSNKIIKNLDFGKSPIANEFLKKPNKNKMYPLKVYRCLSCDHLQLSHVINKKKLFSNYLFVSGTSKTNLDHFKNYANECSKNFLKKNSKVLDIASNDGAFLKFFDKNKIKVGIDPAKNIVSKIKLNDLFLENNFFSYNFSKKIKKKYGKFDLITANNVCAHVDDLNDFMKGVKFLLAKNGVFTFEVGYFDQVYKNKTFDTVYHEHLDYHLFLPLIQFFLKFNLEIFDVKSIFIQGGSLRIYVCNKDQKIKNFKNIDKIIKNEKKINYSNNKIFFDYQKFIEKKRYELKKKIKLIKKKNYKLAGYGASAKSTTFLNFFKINNKYLEFIADKNSLKHFRFTPGTNIKILPVREIYNQNIEYILILSWNFSKEIILENKEFLKKGGKFIISFPKIIIVNKKNYKKVIKQNKL